jgi:hypothetical protein
MWAVLYDSKLTSDLTKSKGLSSGLTSFIVGLTLMSLTLFIFTFLRDPGYLRSDIEFTKVIEVYEDLGQLCPDCLVIRTPRSRHCATCQRCVERFDHHCPWVNNCVGVRNHNLFLVYISIQFLAILATLVASLGVLGQELL